MIGNSCQRCGEGIRVSAKRARAIAGWSKRYCVPCNEWHVKVSRPVATVIKMGVVK